MRLQPESRTDANVRRGIVVKTYEAPVELSERMKRHDMNWSDFIREHIQLELERLEKRECQ